MNDIEQALRRELDDVARHVRTRRVPVGEFLAAGRTARRRRRAVGASLSAAGVVAVLVLATSVTGALSTAPSEPASPPSPTGTDWDVSQGYQSPEPSAQDGISQAEMDVAMASARRWYDGLRTARATPTPATRPGYVAWQGRFIALPRGPRLPDANSIAVGRARTARGFLVSWYEPGIGTGADEGLDVDAEGEGDAPLRLGWITPDEGWVEVEKGSVMGFTLSPDGRSYAYQSRDDSIPWVVTVRDLATDAVLGQYTLPPPGRWQAGTTAG